MKNKGKMLISGKTDSYGKEVLRRFARNRAAVLGAVILTVVVFVCIFAELIAPKELVTAYDAYARLSPPCSGHPFGTDNLGRDIFTRLVYGTRISVGIGVGATLISLVIGAVFAAVCALNRRADFVIMRIVEVVTCIPSVLLALVLLAVMGGSVVNMMVTLTLVSVPGFILRIRAALLAVVEQDYINAAKVSGTFSWKLVLRHILPNAIDPIIVDATMTISSMMLSAAGLSFIGVGVAPPSPEWGAMLNYAQGFMRTAPYMAIFPGLAITLTALSVNLVGDGLRDALDPKSDK